MEIETLKPIIFIIVILFGCILRTYIPYRIKRIKDGRPFNFEYVYSMFMGFLVTSIIVINTDIISMMSLEITSLLILFAGGNGVQDMINRAMPRKV